MPGPCFSWAKSISFKAKSISFKSDSGSDISHESRSGSFSSTPLRGERSKSPSRRYGCSQGCTPSIANLKEMLQGNGSLLSNRSPHSSSCASPSKNESYIHQTKNGDYMYRAPLKSKSNRTFQKRNSFGNAQEIARTSRELVNNGVGIKENLCLVKGCCECSKHCNSGNGRIFPRDNQHHGSLSPKCFCPKCGEAFFKPEALELHQVVRHAVSELGSGTSSLNVIEIIFKTSWPIKGAPCARIERILKIDNTEKHISEFHSYRDSVKKAATDEGMQHERCLADGNELLRFYGSSFICCLGINGSTNLCSMNACNVCSIIRWGFSVRKEKGIFTAASSGKAHEVNMAEEKENWRGKHAMLVCRVIAGRIYRSPEKTSRFNHASCLPDGYDSVSPGSATNMDELTVFNPKAVLPCFLVVYTI